MSQEKIERWDAMNGNDAPQEKLTAFYNSGTDMYAILQLVHTDETAMERFESLSFLHGQGKEPDIDHYELVYTAPLAPYKDQNMMLEDLFTKFNIDRPSDFKGHSLSVSDIVAIKTANVISFHYVDSFGFTELPGFNSGKNHLRALEDYIEQNDNNFDGIINNLPVQEPKVKEEKPSIIEQLKTTQDHEVLKKVSCKKGERSIDG